MEKMFKNIAWIIIASIVCVALATLFGVLCGIDIGKLGEGAKNFKTIILITVLISGLVLIITSVTSFFTVREGGVKTTILAIGKYSRIQNIGPIVALGLAIAGMVINNEKLKEAGSETSSTGMIVLIVFFAASIGSTSFCGRGLKAYRKDKESFMYIAVSSFFVSIFMLAFLIVACFYMSKIGKLQEAGHAVGYAQAYSIFIVLADILSYFTLGLAAYFAHKYAPKVTMADADSKVLDDINVNISKLANNEKTNSKEEKDNVAKLREYKKQLDDGVITQEDFELKKKELL